MRILDLFSCDGGAGCGYRLAGFDVVGVDIAPRPAYPYEFHQGDAIEFIKAHGHEFDAIHASPPCQGYSAPTIGTNAARNAATGRQHPRLIEATREALDATGLPYIIENIPSPAVRRDLMLCGEMFGLPILMHRWFELSGWNLAQPVHPEHRGRVRGWRHGQYFDGPYIACYGKGGGKASVAEMQAAKGIDWTDDHEALREALPPAYTRYVGEALLAHLERAA